MTGSIRHWLAVLCLAAITISCAVPGGRINAQPTLPLVSGVGRPARIGALPINDPAVLNSASAIHAAAIHTADGRDRVIVELADAPLAGYFGGIAGLSAPSLAPAGGAVSYNNKSLDLASPVSKAYLNYLQAAQAAFVSQVVQAIPGTDVVASFLVTFNGIALAVDPSRLAELSTLPGVVRVYPDQLRTVALDASLPLINAPAMWNALGGQPVAGGQSIPGKGIRIAVIDTGIRPTNPMFSGMGFAAPTGAVNGRYCSSAPDDPLFKCNGKIITAGVFPDDGALNYAPQELKNSPLDIDGHGSHTAGIAAGNLVTAHAGQGVPVDTVISGVAPGAYLLVYKALFEVTTPNGLGASGTDTSLIQALDAAFSDGADVISNSWGSAAVLDPAMTAEKDAIDTITKHGVLVVFSAGNSGPDAGSISCPGCVASALTVASSATARIFANPLDVTAPGSVPPALTGIGALRGNGPFLTTSLNAPLRYWAAVPDGCSAFPAGTFAGAVALVNRGTCSFMTKVIDAAGAGALAVVVVNNLPGQPAVMELTGAAIPGYMVDNAAGGGLIQWAAANPSASVRIGAAVSRNTNPAWQSLISDFSSAGPDGDPDVLKPDLTAPGQMILSAFSPALISGAADPYYAVQMGTSMAAPHVAGAAALLFQLHPTWTPIQVKTALTSTANGLLSRYDSASGSTKSADPFSMGAGRLDLAAAAKTGLTFDQPSFANHNCVVVCTFIGKLTNTTAAAETWSASTTGSTSLFLAVEPASVTLAPGATASFKVTVDVSGAVVGRWVFGRITWNGASKAYSPAGQPVAVLAAGASDPDAISISVDKPTYQIGDILTYNLILGNIYPSLATYSITNLLPPRTEFLANSATTGLVYDTATNTVRTKDPLLIPALVANVAPTGKPTLYQTHTFTVGDINLNQYCATACDNTRVTLTPIDFIYMGRRYNSITVFSSGFLVPGNVPAVLSDTTIPQALPSKTGLNNIIAPLWGHLVLKGGSAANSHTGIWTVWKSTGYTVFDWRNAQAADNLARAYSFQVWIKTGTNEITFSYGSLGDLVNEKLSVGMENDTGAQGKSAYYSSGGASVGIPPAAGTDLAVLNSMTFLSLSYKVKVVSASIFQPAILNYAIASDSLFPADSFAASVHSDWGLLRLYFPVLLR